MKHLLPYFKKYWWQSVLAPLFKMLEATFDLLVPLVVANIINVGVAQRDSKEVWLQVGLLLGMAVLGLLCSFTAQYFAAETAIGTSAGLRRELMVKIQSLSAAQLDTIGTSTLITRMTSDANQVQNGVNMFLRLFLRSPFIVFGAMIAAFTIDRGLALIFVAVIIVLFAVVFGIMALTNPLYKQQSQQLDAVTGAARENLNGVRVIRAFGAEKTQAALFQKINDRLLNIQEHAGKLAAYMNPLTYVVVNAGIIAILWFGADRVNGGVLLSGDIVALINYISQILVELVKLANLVVLLGKAIAGMGRIGQVLDTPAEMEFNGTGTGKTTREVLRFENVSLRYNAAAEDSISDISFTLEEGQTLGIIGGTGSGKSSIVNLIPRLYDATSGTVYLKGMPIQEWEPSALRKCVAVVEQKATLFAGTIRSNLLWGNENATDEELWQALETAQAAEFVRTKPLGLDEIVEQGGRNLSGGQKQRLTIARALAAKPDILILDDSASALDFATDAALRKALKRLQGVTVIIVSQRTSSIAHADQILVLEDGILAGKGIHDSLLESCPVYREIYQIQFRKEGAV